MASLDRNLRRNLENAVKKARRVAEAGARQAIEQLAVQHHEPWGTLNADQRKLRQRLRAHGRQLGDLRDERKGTQEINRLIDECAYEHWHRLLFARFLAENHLLIEPHSQMPLSLDECRELARVQRLDWLMLASDFAQRMLPQIFRSDDPVLDVTLPPEHRQELESFLESLPRDVFIADDSLGWVYQFWQTEQKDRVNKSEKKIGANELPAVTQLFTEDYMVLFLLHNTLGAWWAGKTLAARPELVREATTEEALRTACALPDVHWEYLRFVRDEDGWRPAAGTFDGWPEAAKDITLLDPCMGSGHFLAFALSILVAIRMREESIHREAAVDSVLQENLFGLEIDSRCTQIAAFNLALAAWRMSGQRALPALNLACSGLCPSARKEDWMQLAGDDLRVQNGMERLYSLFEQAPVLGSLIDPRATQGTLLNADFEQLQPLVRRALARETSDDATRELAVTAWGITRAVTILAGHFTLVLTNVPYLGRGKQHEVLKDYCQQIHPKAKADLATCFVERCLEFCAPGGSIALVTPQNWWFLGSYTQLRRDILSRRTLATIATLGEEAWQSFGDRGPVAALLIADSKAPSSRHIITGLDALPRHTIDDKINVLRSGAIQLLSQSGQYRNPDHRIVIGEPISGRLLKEYADCLQGCTTGDNPRYILQFWELPEIGSEWEFFQATVETTQFFGGRQDILRWERGGGELAASSEARVQGQALFGRIGVFVSQMRELPVTIYSGQFYNMNGAALVPRRVEHLPAVWAFCSAPEFNLAVREIDRALKVTNATLVKVPFDLSHWQQIAEKKFPQGLPRAHSDDPAQWLFSGHPFGSDQPLQVAVARLLGYRWPRQTGSNFPDCPVIDIDGLESHADADGIVPLTSLRGEAAAADRLRALLADSYGSERLAERQIDLTTAVGFAGSTIDEWLRNGFFEQHCNLFGQRPFIWHIWDGLKDGFGALVNYHRLSAPNGEGRRTLEKLIYTYLGDWIDRQRADQKLSVDGADGRVAAAEHLKRELVRILDGEPPYDIFVRWKPLHQQPVGWEPDLGDGVRINIRPFMIAKPLVTRGRNACILRETPKIKWDKDRGKEPYRLREDYPWFWGWDEQAIDYLGGTEFDGKRHNNLHYSRAVKLAAHASFRQGSRK